MFNYAQLNENNVCVGVSSLSGEVSDPKMVPINELSLDFLWKKYENGQWSVEKFEPQSTAPLTEFEQLKADNNLLGQQLVEKDLQIMELQQQNNTLGQQLVDMDLRLLNLEMGGVA